MTLREKKILELERGSTRTLWRNHFGRGYGPVVRQKTELKIPILKEQNTNAWAQFT